MPSAVKKTDKTLERQRLDEIYAKAAQIFHRKGFDATSMSDIAEAVQLTKAGLYYYISSKQELLYAILSYAMDRLEEGVVRPAKEIADPEERLRTMIRSHARMLIEGNRWIPILTDEVDALAPKHRREMVDRKRNYLDLVRSTLDELKQAGKLRDLDTTVAAFSLFGMLLWLPRWYQPSGRMTSQEVVEQVVRMALGGLFVDASGVDGPRGK